MATDMNRRPLAAGTRVEAWWDGERYTGTIQQVHPHAAGDENFSRITVLRDGDGAEMETFSDAVGILPE
jgi:hypothetical protein